MADHTLSSVDRRLSRSRVARALLGREPAPVAVGPYHVVGRIGEGGMGVVYEALHPATGEHVALKMLRERGFGALQQLQREFRVLSELEHPNLVHLHELSVEGGVPYLTMELVHGERPADFVAASGTRGSERARSVLQQLVDAVGFLHAHGVVHRDLKPSNLLVTAAGRVVVLDFGLARSIAAAEDSSASGTPRYMAPERAHGVPADEASDWYSVGAVMCEALTGVRYVGELPSELLAADPPETRELRALCARLLAAEPRDRPGADELRARLGIANPTPRGQPLRVFDDSALFVGRSAELRALREARAGLGAAASTVVLLHGQPGVGKTALVRQFLAEQNDPDASFVVSGRCYDSELIPYNAFDEVIGGLARIVAALPDAWHGELSACATPELLRSFPGLQLAFERSAAPDSSADDVPQDLRSSRVRAFSALHTLLQALARLRPVVIHIDDLQWGDADSAELLGSLFSSNVLGGVLLIAGFRTADGPWSPCVQRLRTPSERAAHRVLELPLATLDPSSARELAGALASHLPASELDALTGEAAGSPLFLRALLQSHGQRDAAAPLGMAVLLHGALETLAPLERTLLELTALCGRPIGRDLLLRAAAQSSTAANAVDALRTLKRRALIRLVPGQTFECLHDRVREHVLEAISEPRAAAGHLALAVAAAQARELDSEFLAHHYRGAGQLSDAAHHAELAGDRAFAGLALDHAARLYALALACRAGHEPHALRVKLADAIASTGRCSEAAPLYLAAAQTDDPEQAILLRTRAAQMHFQAGERAQGGVVLAPLLRAMRLRPARNPLHLFVWVYARMLHVRLLVRVPWLRARVPSRTERLHAEVSFRLSQTLHTIDSALVTQLVVHMLPVALRDESPDRRALALAHYAAMSAMLDIDTQARQDALLQEAAALSLRATQAETGVWVQFLRGVVELNRGRFPESLNSFESVWRSLDEGFVESHWLRRESLLGQCSMLALTGGFRELARIEARLHELSRYQDNAFQETHLRQQLCFLWLAQGKAEQVRTELRAYRVPERAQDILQPDAFLVWASVQHQLYVGEPVAARAELKKYWRLLESAGYTRFEPWRTGFLFLRGTVAMACLAAGGGSRDARAVRACRAQLRKTPLPFATGGTALLDAGLLHASGQLTAAAEHYASAAVAFAACGMAGYAAAARVRYAQLVDPAGAEFQRAQAWFDENAVADPSAWVRMYAPVQAARGLARVSRT